MQPLGIKSTLKENFSLKNTAKGAVKTLFTKKPRS
jgi:hypothetical protein